ncbi:FAD/NAD(P)-binding protein [Sphingomonas sp. HDW15A]|uniref:FAD/NAD(P)-binding protein n=1 Tax=Sphingomonas sp. HDW15A TaxID=2714942 RepID=UPI001F10B7C6|nr:FAD/NAD(P)-binding protein [Sphingomonas sp. HDW15A]
MALQLARRGVKPLLIDRAEAWGRGIAYSTGDPAHLLNVPAMKMSAWPDAPKDFAETANLPEGAFAERRAYGDYLRVQLEQAVADGTVAVADAYAVSAARSDNGWRIALNDGRGMQAEQIVLATGNGSPHAVEIPGWPEDDMVQDPWSAETQARLACAAKENWPILLIGAGLTMVDLVLTLDRMGHGGPVTAVSRRGLVPCAHQTPSIPLPAPELEEIPERLSHIVRWLRARGAHGNWRAAIDSLRPATQALWASWPTERKARFLRHARPWWDVHRHRIAPQAAAIIDRWSSEGRLKVIAGRIREGASGKVTIGLRNGGLATIATMLAINCTGPNERITESGNRLLRQMLDDGLIAPGPLDLGVRADDDSRAGENLWALGPMTKGEWWEITAVPDIRVQVEKVAAAIAACI